MAIEGIDAVVYGVNDMEKARRYFADWGLAKAKSGNGEYGTRFHELHLGSFDYV